MLVDQRMPIMVINLMKGRSTRLVSRRSDSGGIFPLWIEILSQRTVNCPALKARTQAGPETQKCMQFKRNQLRFPWK